MTVSYAQSLDGRIATATGESKWISGEATLELAHELRGENQAILVGIGTVLRDDPELTCRLPGCKSPVRIILDGSLRTPLTSRIVQTAGKYRTIVISNNSSPEREQLLRDKQIEVIEIPETHDRLETVLDKLADLGLETVFVEGGAAVITSFLRAGLVDSLIVVTAPILIGEGISAVADLGVRALSEAYKPIVENIYTTGSEVVHRLVFDGGRNA